MHPHRSVPGCSGLLRHSRAGTLCVFNFSKLAFQAQGGGDFSYQASAPCCSELDKVPEKHGDEAGHLQSARREHPVPPKTSIQGAERSPREERRRGAGSAEPSRAPRHPLRPPGPVQGPEAALPPPATPASRGWEGGSANPLWSASDREASSALSLPNVMVLETESHPTGV